MLRPTLRQLGAFSVLALASLLHACSPIRVLNAMAPDDTHRRVDGLAYGEHPRQRLDVYTPVRLEGLAPVVLFFYGGSWQSGSREEYRFVGEALAARGIVTVVADYRLFPEVRYPDFLADAAAAAAWVRREIAAYGGDPERIVLAGHSAGAYNAAMLALDPRWLAEQGLRPEQFAAWVGIAGPYNFRPIVARNLKRIFNPPETPESTPDETQPIVHATAGAPPALLLAARKDHLVYSDRNTGELAERLRELGVAVDERYYDNLNHYTVLGAMGRPLRQIAPITEHVADFVLGVQSTATQTAARPVTGPGARLQLGTTPEPLAEPVP